MHVTERRASAVASDEAGLGLVELIVGVLVSTIVLIAVGAILVNSWLTQSDVLSTSEATNRGQLMSAQIERAVRNGLSFDPATGGVPASTGSELLVLTSFNTPVGADPRTCQAFNLGGGKAQSKMAVADLSTASWATWVDDAGQNWRVLVEQSGTTPFFEKDGRTLAYTFEIATDSAPVRFHGEVSLRAPSTGATSPCW